MLADKLEIAQCKLLGDLRGCVTMMEKKYGSIIQLIQQLVLIEHFDWSGDVA